MGDDVSLLTEILDITERATHEVTGFRAPEGGDNRVWFRAFDQLARLRRLAVSTSAHDLVVLVDTAVLHANARAADTRAAWLAAYRAIRDAAVRERGLE